MSYYEVVVRWDGAEQVVAVENHPNKARHVLAVKITDIEDMWLKKKKAKVIHRGNKTIIASDGESWYILYEKWRPGAMGVSVYAMIFSLKVIYTGWWIFKKPHFAYLKSEEKVAEGEIRKWTGGE